MNLLIVLPKKFTALGLWYKCIAYIYKPISFYKQCKPGFIIVKNIKKNCQIDYHLFYHSLTANIIVKLSVLYTMIHFVVSLEVKYSSFP